MADQPLVVFTEGSHPTPKAWLAERCAISDDIADLPSAHGAVVRTYTTVDDAWLDAAPHLKAVGRGGVGLDNIDVAACRARGVEVVYTPDANTRAVAEFVHGLMLRLVRPWHVMGPTLPDAEGFRALRKDAGAHLCDLTLGILGMGRVGQATARIAHVGFGMRVIYHDLLDIEPRVGAEAVSLDELVTGCDVLTVHVDGRPTNRHLVDAKLLDKATFRWLINTSRGLVVDAAAVAQSLAADRLRGVALDVYDPEPPAADSAYAALLANHGDRVILTPHMASRTGPAVENMSWVVRDIWRVLTGEPPNHLAP